MSAMMILAILSFFLWGRLVLRLMFGQRRVEFFLRLPLMFGLGCFAAAWLLFVFLLAGGRISAPVAWIMCIVPFAALVCEGVYRLIHRKSAALPGHRPQHKKQRWYVRMVQFICLLFVICLAVTIFHNSQQAPLTGDARVIWGYKAKIIYYESLYSEDFRDESQVHQHPNYPLLVPIIEAYSYALMGGVDDLRVKIVFPVFYVCLLMALYAGIRRYLGPVAAPVLIAVFATFFPLKFSIGEGSASSGYADIPLTMFYTTGVVLLLRWLSSRTAVAGDDRRSRFATLLAAGLMLAAAAFTKNEGLPLAAIACIPAMFVVLTGRASVPRRALPALLLTACVILALSLPWLAWRAGLPSIDEDYPSRLNTEGLRYGLANHAAVIAKHAIDSATPVHAVGRVRVRPLFGIDGWYLFWPILAVTCVLFIGRCFRKNNLFIVLLLFNHILLYLIILLIVPPSAWRIDRLLFLITHRLFMHFSGIALLLLAALLGPGEGQSESDRCG